MIFRETVDRTEVCECDHDHMFEELAGIVSSPVFQWIICELVRAKSAVISAIMFACVRVGREFYSDLKFGTI